MRIVAAAIKKNGKVFIGRQYSEIITTNPSMRLESGRRGFITDIGNQNNFVSPEDAASIAFISGQIDKPQRMLNPNDIFD